MGSTRCSTRLASYLQRSSLVLPRVARCGIIIQCVLFSELCAMCSKSIYTEESISPLLSDLQEGKDAPPVWISTSGSVCILILIPSCISIVICISICISSCVYIYIYIWIYVWISVCFCRVSPEQQRKGRCF